jgi:hypothetical protein
MSCYIVYYRFRKESDSEDFYRLEENIKLYDSYAQILPTSWAVITEKTADEVKDDLKKYIDPIDSIFVIQSGIESMWKNIMHTRKCLQESVE